MSTLKQQKLWRESDRGLTYKRRRTLERYGLSVDDYELLLEAQNFVCAICHKPETRKDGRSGRTIALAVDHCHSTGRVRGLLCAKCNMGIGHFEDETERLERILEYLRA